MILIHTPSESRFGCQDANLAYQNGSLMAESLGVASSTPVSSVRPSNKTGTGGWPKCSAYPGRYAPVWRSAYRPFRYPNYIDRKDINVTKL